MTETTTAPVLDVDALLKDRSIRTILSCGSGGVGKTTMAAALALRAAEEGRTVVVLTIDPARRLAQSLGLDELGDEPHQVADVGAGSGGRLDAMTLDMKRTFDELVRSHADPERAAQILRNPFYESLSSSFAGTQEYMAMEKLGQLHALDQWDLVVVDTPPSRSALDFLDAPRRLGSFLDGRFLRLLTAPTRGPAYLRVMSVGMSMLTSTVSRLLGAQLLADVQAFLSAFETAFGGFRQRAERTYAALQNRETAFVVVATPERDALREASYFVDRLEADGMPLAGLLLNRVHVGRHSPLGSERALELARELVPEAPKRGGEMSPRELTASLLRLHAANHEQARQEAGQVRRFLARHPAVPLAVSPALPVDVHDLPRLRSIGDGIQPAGPLGDLSEPAEPIED